MQKMNKRQLRRQDFRVQILVMDKDLKHMKILTMSAGEFTLEDAEKGCLEEAKRLYPEKKVSLLKGKAKHGL
jgi:hypothetical protein